ncbi:conserved hypothetical protein [Sporisorium reilianum SRZ2]|uniref:Uncharacterized protein n=1 Tax=Sporisorium reilianum (strain SRZ2) TaxID=999809 RepID=E6ZVQ7_SPORE|nr:conserved hypothetical protein [Sporisorium reilianum SRZ2]
MAYLPISTDLVSCTEGSGVSLEKGDGARIDLLRWRSQSTDSAVELPVYVDGWLGANAGASIEQVVVHLHGKERDGNVAWDDIAAARSRLSVDQQRTTLIVVPQFLNGLDKAKIHASNQSHLLMWKSNGWGDGSTSVRPKPSALNDGGISSFEALDAIVCHFANRQLYASIKRIVVSGHSMGGQLVQRYSILGAPPLSPQQRQAVRVEYVVMNPASYLYFNAERPGAPAADANVYKYGFNQLASKVSTYRGIENSQDAQFYLDRMLRERTVAFLHGEADRGVGDDRPEAMAQGAFPLTSHRASVCKDSVS